MEGTRHHWWGNPGGVVAPKPDLVFTLFGLVPKTRSTDRNNGNANGQRRSQLNNLQINDQGEAIIVPSSLPAAIASTPTKLLQPGARYPPGVLSKPYAPPQF